jgi:hypothetical protein
MTIIKDKGEAGAKEWYEAIKFWLTLDEVIWKFKNLNEYLKGAHY